MTIANVNVIPFRIYPNPANDFLTIETNTQETLNAEILDMNGRVVFATPITDKQTLDVRKLASAVYQIKLTGAQGTAVQLWVKE